MPDFYQYQRAFGSSERRVFGQMWATNPCSSRIVAQFVTKRPLKHKNLLPALMGVRVELRVG